MESEAAKARYGRLHDERKWHDGSFAHWAKEPSDAYPYRFDMGVTQGVSDVDVRPTDTFLTDERASWPPPPQGDQPSKATPSVP
jgi:hypothetical protein